ncbi:MAG: hypothetical protein KAS32_26845 [Candidatus Peribacteraceae bacterium]|nr:hypothetical protein [Candidatus Peribacteraceae bacterium]
MKIIKKTTTPHYRVDDYKNPPSKKIKKEKGKDMYRTKVVYDKEGQRHLIKFAVMKHKGPRGGTTKATSHWREK